jgi:hypothetical protein
MRDQQRSEVGGTRFEDLPYPANDEKPQDIFSLNKELIDAIKNRPDDGLLSPAMTEMAATSAHQSRHKADLLETLDPKPQDAENHFIVMKATDEHEDDDKNLDAVLEVGDGIATAPKDDLDGLEDLENQGAESDRPIAKEEAHKTEKGDDRPVEFDVDYVDNNQRLLEHEADDDLHHQILNELVLANDMASQNRIRQTDIDARMQ